MTFAFGGIGTTLTIANCHTVLLKLAAVDNNALWDPRAGSCRREFLTWLSLFAGRWNNEHPAKPEFAPWIINKASCYPYQDYKYSVPFSAWDMDTEPPTRLAVGHIENNATDGLLDGRYWQDTTIDNRSAQEMAFIFRSPYTDAADPVLTVNLSNNKTTPLMWVIACNRRAEEPWPGTDQFMINAYHFPTSKDVWMFNPSVMADVRQADQPLRFALLQNYPNPFNPVTTIRYELPAQSEVTITVYDVLGRAVRHRIREVQPAGSHTVLWHADTDAGGSVASGVYFYRYTAARSDHNGYYEHTMKMILLK
ncbi:MAG: T9SS type A sorting domain-containing protein [Ignavibacteriae bacterium]|nr:T9SS type A sorting domain-containing protein [Ignavibacteriota bacterium]